MAIQAISVEGLRGRLAVMHERYISDAPSLAHISRPEQRARLAVRLIAPYVKLSSADFELLLVEWMESAPLPSVVEVCSVLAALLCVDSAEPASTLADLIVEAMDRGKPNKRSRPDRSVVWWAHCICERCEPLAKHLPAVQQKLRDCLTTCDSDLPSVR